MGLRKRKKHIYPLEELIFFGLWIQGLGLYEQPSLVTPS